MGTSNWQLCVVAQTMNSIITDRIFMQIVLDSPQESYSFSDFTSSETWACRFLAFGNLFSLPGHPPDVFPIS